MDIFVNCGRLRSDIGTNEFTAMIRIEWAIFWWIKTLCRHREMGQKFAESDRIFYRYELLETIF